MLRNGVEEAHYCGLLDGLGEVAQVSWGAGEHCLEDSPKHSALPTGEGTEEDNCGLGNCPLLTGAVPGASPELGDQGHLPAAGAARVGLVSWCGEDRKGAEQMSLGDRKTRLTLGGCSEERWQHLPVAALGCWPRAPPLQALLGQP